MSGLEYSKGLDKLKNKIVLNKLTKHSENELGSNGKNLNYTNEN